MASSLPLVVSLNCLEDTSFEVEALAGAATVEHVGLSHLADGRIESAVAVLLHSLAFLPRAAQRRLQPWQLILCLGSSDRAVDSTLATDLGLRLVHVDVNRAEEIADTIMALFLALLRRTNLLSQYSSSSSAASGWFGSIQPLCRGMRRCRGLVLGIIGRSASARFLAIRSLAFSMSVLYFDVNENNYAKGRGKFQQSSITFPPAARKMDTLNDLLAASDLVSLHCASSDEPVQVLDAECLQHIKPGAFVVNTSNSQLIDDYALKQLLIDGTIAGCALDGAEGPQWMEAWVREMPNVLILPRSADYSEEVWMEIREKAISMLQAFFLDNVIPNNDISDEGEENSGIAYEGDRAENLVRDNSSPPLDSEQKADASQFCAVSDQKLQISQSKESKVSGSSQNTVRRSDRRHSRSSKKAKKRRARRSCQQKSLDFSGADGSYSSQQEEDAAISGMEQSSRFASPEDSKSKQICLFEPNMESSSQKSKTGSGVLYRNCIELLKEGFVIALHTGDRTGLHVSRQRVPGGGWFLDVFSNVTKRDPAAQFLVSFKSKGVLGLRSFAAGGKLLQINRRTEFIFASYNFDAWESWILEGSLLENCRLVNCRNPLVVLDVSLEILAVVDEEDGVARWLG